MRHSTIRPFWAVSRRNGEAATERIETIDSFSEDGVSVKRRNGEAATERIETRARV